MLDIKFVRENPDAIDVAMANRQTSWDREKFFELDDERRAVITEVEELQATRNAESKKIGALMKEGKKDEAEAAKEAVRAVNEKIDGLAERRTALEQEQYDFMAHLPNIPCEATPYGKDEDENIERRRWGTPREFDFDFKPHWDLGTDLDILDFERGNKLSGSRFTVLGGAGAGPGHHRLRARGEAGCQPLHPVGRPGRPPGARPHQLLPRYAHQPWF